MHILPLEKSESKKKSSPWERNERWMDLVSRKLLGPLRLLSKVDLKFAGLNGGWAARDYFFVISLTHGFKDDSSRDENFEKICRASELTREGW